MNDYEYSVDYPHKFDKIILLNLCCNYFLGLFQAIMISRNNTYEIDKVRWYIYIYMCVYALKIIQYNYDDYMI